MGVLTDEHYRQFGRIIQYYADVEWGIRCLLAGIWETPLMEAVIASQPYTAAALKDVAKSSVKISRLTEDQQSELIDIVGTWSGFGKLRNAIAHRRWDVGKRDGSVRPSGFDIRSGKAKLIGDTDQDDWSLDELSSEADRLHELNTRAIAFFFNSGIAHRIEEADQARIVEAQEKSTET